MKKSRITVVHYVMPNSQQNVAIWVRHLKSVHENIKDYCCPLCDAKFSQKGDLKKHVKSVHEKLFTVCGYMYFKGKDGWHFKESFSSIE